MQILVVDDEEHLRRMMRLTLEAAGYEVEEAADGEEALKLFGDGHRGVRTPQLTHDTDPSPPSANTVLPAE